jgi:hypothetical protein
VKQLLVLRGLPHDPKSVLTTVYRFAGVSIELFLDTALGLSKLTQNVHVCRELRVTPLTDAQDRDAFGLLYDPKFALLHDCSLAHQAGRS